MKTLLLMRHAKSSWSSAKLADHDRPLNDRGLADVPKMGELLASLDVVPDVILCSTAERARQTVELLCQTLPFEGEVIYSRMLYHAGDEVFNEELGRLGDEIEIAMIVGHNPGMEYAVENYTGDWERMSTASVARIEFPISNWGEMADEPEGELTGLWRPKEIG